jgi:hypothetical protein
MKVYVVVETERGLIINIAAYLRQKDQQKYFEKCVKANSLTVEEPYNYDYEVYMSDSIHVVEPHMVLAGERRAMAKLEALCS